MARGSSSRGRGFTASASKSRPSTKTPKPAAKGIFGSRSAFAGIGRNVLDDGRSTRTGLRSAPPPHPSSLPGRGGSGGGAPAGSGIVGGIAAVSFDGVSDRMEFNGALSGVTNTKVGIASFWIRNQDATNVTNYIYHQTHFNFHQLDGPTDAGIMQGDDTGGGLSMDHSHNNPAQPADGWVHFMYAWDLLNGNIHQYRNDVSVHFTGIDVDDIIDYAQNTLHEINVADTASTPGLATDYSEIYINFDAYLDLSVESNRRKFITAGLKPADLGADGSLPTGSQPPIYLSGPASEWNAGNANKGYSSAFTVVGSLEDATSTPAD